MPRKTETVAIGGFEYRITQLGATTGGQVMFRLGRAFAVIMAGLKDGTFSVESLSPADFDWLVKTMQGTTQVGIPDVKGDGSVKFHNLSLLFDDHFAGRYPELIEWLKGALEVNYGPLGAALGSIFRGATALSDSKLPPGSTGSSPDSSSVPG